MKRVYIFIASVISLIAMSVPASAYEPTVREDRVWEYFTEHWIGFSMDYEAALAKFKFDGTAEVNGKTYHKWVRFQETYWRNTVDSDGRVHPGIPTENKTIETYALMREEEGKIWMCMAQNPENDSQTEIGQMFQIVTDVDSIKSEMICERVVYDFTLNENDSVTEFIAIDPTESSSHFAVYKNLSPMNGTVIAAESVEVNGKICKTITYQYMSKPFIQGIGHEFDLLPYVTPHITSDAGDFFLNGVYDIGGTRIYGEGKETVPQAGIDGISTFDSSDSRKYDLMGREIKDPAPGTVYIQGGRKLIAR